MCKKITIVHAVPCGGKSTIKSRLDGYDVLCVDMSDVLKEAGRKDPEISRLMEELAADRKLMPCKSVMQIFTSFLKENKRDRMVVFGAPRTLKQALEIVDHPELADFKVRSVLDLSVDLCVVESRFEERKLRSTREDDQVPWNVFKADRVDPFHESRHDILKVFNHHKDWHVTCMSGDDDDSASKVANRLVKTMDLRLRQVAA